MRRNVLPRATALLRDESGASYAEWVYPLLLLGILGGIASDQIAGHWVHARHTVSISIPLPVLDWLP